MSEIKHKITNLLKGIEDDEIKYDQLKFIHDYILENTVEKKDAFLFLEILHSSTTLKILCEHNSNEWAFNISKLIEKYNFHLGQLLYQRSIRYKNKVAINIIDGDKKIEISYNKLWIDILEIANALQNIEIDKKVVVGILSTNQYKSATLDLACLSFGFRVIPIPLNSTKDHLSFILKEASITHLFLGSEKGVQLWNSVQDDHKLNIIDINDIGTLKSNSTSWNDFVDLGKDNLHIQDIDGIKDQNMKDTSTIMYTSGSTSNPKGVKFSQLNIISKRFARALALPDISNEDTFLCYLPLFHTFGRYFELMGSLFWGATYTFAESPSFNSLLKDFKIVSPTVFISIPKRWVQIYDLMNNSLDLDLSSKKEVNEKLKEITGKKLKWGLSAAGFLDPDIFRFFQENHIELISGYGMTEATGGITMTPPNQYIVNSVGKALPGIELKIEEDGELLMKGPYISSGFFKDEQSESFDDGWFYSGDIFKKENGYYFIIDRKKDIYKNSRGQTIAPQKIENLFQDFDLVKSVFLVGDGKEYNTVLIYPNKNNADLDLKNMNENQVQEIFSVMLISINGFLSPFERIVNFSIIGRNFTKENNELTQKGTYKRKNILHNFSKTIKSMYKKDYVSLYNENKEIKFPNWLIREIGTIKSNVKWNGNEVSINDKNIFLTFRWLNEKVSIGGFNYIIENQIFDLSKLINDPKLWLGNTELIDFISEPIYRIKEPIAYEAVSLIINSGNFSNTKIEQPNKENESQLQAINNSLSLYLNSKDSFHISLNQLINSKNNEWVDVIIDTFIQYLKHPKPIFRIKLLETISPIISEELFVDQLKDNFRYYVENQTDEDFNFDVTKINIKQYNRLIGLLKTLHGNIGEIDSTDKKFIQKVLSIICEYGKIHPTQFISARSELVWWQLSKSPSQIQSLAQKEYYNLINGFRLWLGPNTSLTIDRETKEEYTWSEVITFDDNVRKNYREKLIKAISSTALIKESIFLSSNDTILQLSDIPKDGIWIKNLNTKNGKSAFRILVKTISFGTYNIVLNLNHNLERDFFEEEIKWLILMGSPSSGQNQLVEKFCGYWPEESIYTEEYITDDTVNIHLERYKEEINSSNKTDRWQMRWLHYIWNGVQAYIEFWQRTDNKLAIHPPIPDNLIIPPHDYNTGNRIISISERKKVTSVGQFYLDLYSYYIINTESRFPGLKHMADWELIFTATLEATKVKNGIPILKTLKNDILKKENKNIFKGLGLTEERIDIFLKDFENFGVLTKPVVFAALRYERWLDLNHNAKNEAKASILKELYHDYNLNSLLDEYPETRVRFFMMTCLKNSGDNLNSYFRFIIKDMRAKKLSPWNLKDRIEEILVKTDLSDNDKFFLARMLYPHIDAADYVELVKTNKGDKKNLDLVFKTEDSKGKIFMIRPPFQPKEIAKFQSIISRENLSVTFNANHEFLFLINDRNNVVGGLYYKIKNKTRVHLEWVVIMKKYQNRNLSERLMDDFFNRLKQMGIELITVGFYHESFFYKQGFNIDQSFGGLIKRL
ncbi:MAG: GNAT family N-acetyltransferase [Candidatus Neomarinimicrobiota bacterium]